MRLADGRFYQQACAGLHADSAYKGTLSIEKGVITMAAEGMVRPLGGRVCLPGLTDAHLHIFPLALLNKVIRQRHVHIPQNTAPQGLKFLGFTLDTSTAIICALFNRTDDKNKMAKRLGNLKEQTRRKLPVRSSCALYG